MKQILRLIGYDVLFGGWLKKANFLVSVLVEQITVVVSEKLEFNKIECSRFLIIFLGISG